MKKVAAIDMGSNAIRLGLATLKARDDYFIVDRERTPIRLGEEAFSQGSFSNETMERVLNCFEHYKERMELDGVHYCRAVATSAFRNSKNSKELADKVHQQTGILIDVIDGTLEAGLIRNAISTKMSLEAKDWLLIDIGGGSIEISVFIKGKFEDSVSLPLGTVRLLKNLRDENTFEELINQYSSQLDGFFERYHKIVKHFRVVGTGGNFRRLLKLKRRILPQGRGDRIYPDEVLPILKILEKEDIEQRIVRYNLRLDAADVIIPALYLINNVLSRTKVKKIYTPDIGLLDGLFIEMSDMA